MRVLVAWCPGWPVAVLGHDDGAEPVAVFERRRVVAASGAALAQGVAPGQPRREAERHCPGLVARDRDQAAEARAFERVAAAVATLNPLVEVVEPGTLALDARGPARYFGGEEALRRRVLEVTRPALPLGSRALLQTGIADGRFAALLAARRDRSIPVGETRAFLAPYPVAVLGDADLAGLLVRLGLPTLGAFAALPAGAVRARFGTFGELAQRRALGLEDETLQAFAPAEELAARTDLDPPAERVDVAAFASRALAAELVTALEERGLTCTRLMVEAGTEHGENLARRWRAEDRFSVPTIVERLRWQLEGWLSGGVPEPAPTAGICWLRVVADEVVPARGRQLRLFGGCSDADERAVRGLDRLRGLLGPTAVLTAVLQGGRGPADRVALVPWGEVVPVEPVLAQPPVSPRPPVAGVSARPPAGSRSGGRAPGEESGEAPWPGHHPCPAPALVHQSPIPAELVDESGEPVRVLVRGRFAGTPARLSLRGGPSEAVLGWSGPWLLDERAWDPSTRRRRARCQLLTGQLHAYLACFEAGRWWIEASYD